MTDVFQPRPEDTLDDTAPKLDDLRGEGKKYKDDDAVAKAIVEKDRFIARLLEEKREVEAALKERNNEEEFLTRMERLVQPQPKANEDTTPREPVREAAVDPAKIEEIVSKKLTEAQRKAKAEANLNEVTKKLEGMFGANYRAKVATQAQQLGVGTEWLSNLAAENPAAFYRVLGIDQAKTVDAFSPPPTSQVNTASFSTSSGAKNYAYYQEMRRKNGENWYFSSPVQREIWEQAKAQGGTPEERTGFYKR